MRIFNRIVAILVLLVLLATGIVVLVLQSGILPLSTIDRLTGYSPLRSVARDLAATNAPQFPFTPVIAALLVLFALLGLLGELRPRKPSVLTLQSGEGRSTEISYRTLGEVVQESLQSLTGIEQAGKARVQERRGQLDVRCKARLGRLATAEEMVPRAKQFVSEQLQHLTGLPVRTVRLDTSASPQAAQGKRAG